MFFAAFAGLGELVGWPWNSEVNDMKIANDSGISLLSIVAEYGKAWVVSEMLKADFEIGTVSREPASRL